MNIKWLGHATFAITLETGLKIITDPVANGDLLTYDELDESADIIELPGQNISYIWYIIPFAVVLGAAVISYYYLRHRLKQD